MDSGGQRHLPVPGIEPGSVDCTKSLAKSSPLHLDYQTGNIFLGYLNEANIKTVIEIYNFNYDLGITSNNIGMAILEARRAAPHRKEGININAFCKFLKQEYFSCNE